MWNKIFLVVLGLSIALMTFFSYYSWSWLQSIGLPAAAVAGYEYHAAYLWTALWLTSVVLLLLGNAVLWTSRTAWAMWSALIYFAVFVISKYFWLDEAFLSFKKTNGMFDGSFSLGPFFAVFLIVLAGVIVFFDQFIALQLHRKMYPLPANEPPPVDSPEPEHKED